MLLDGRSSGPGTLELHLSGDARAEAIYERRVLVSVEGGLGSGTYGEGQTVRVSASDRPASLPLVREVFDRWEGLDSDSAEHSFEASRDLYVRAVYSGGLVAPAPGHIGPDGGGRAARLRARLRAAALGRWKCCGSAKVDARLLACAALACLPPAACAAEASLPCSVSSEGRLFAAEYGGQPRRNPDGSFYPGDAFYYLFRFSASETCIGLSLGPVESHDGLDLSEHRAVTWQDAGRWHPGQAEERKVDVGQSRPHPHSDMSREPRLFETVHYYRQEGGPTLFSAREDGQLQGWQKRALAGSAYLTRSTWGWDYAPRGAAHGHLPPCEPWMLEAATVLRGEADYGGGRCAAPDVFEDPGSRAKFMEAVGELCSAVRLYSGVRLRQGPPSIRRPARQSACSPIWRRWA